MMNGLWTEKQKSEEKLCSAGGAIKGVKHQRKKQMGRGKINRKACLLLLGRMKSRARELKRQTDCRSPEQARVPEGEFCMVI